MNIISNAIDALDSCNDKRAIAQIHANSLSVSLQWTKHHHPQNIVAGD